jgi:hypothetical protein
VIKSIAMVVIRFGGQQTRAKIVKAPSWRRRNVILAVILAIVLVPLIYSMVLNTLHYNITSRQAEAKSNLPWIYRAETEYSKRHGRFGNFDEIKFMPGERSRYNTYRYTYRIGPEGDAPSIRVPTGGGVAAGYT